MTNLCCTPAQHTTCGERDHPRPFFFRLKNSIPLTPTSQSGPDQSPLYFRPTYALPDEGPLIADPSIFPERKRAGIDRFSGVNGPLVKVSYFLQDIDWKRKKIWGTKHGCPWRQQSQNMAKYPSPTFWPRPTPRGMWCQWSVGNS